MTRGSRERISPGLPVWPESRFGPPDHQAHSIEFGEGTGIGIGDGADEVEDLRKSGGSSRCVRPPVCVRRNRWHRPRPAASRSAVPVRRRSICRASTARAQGMTFRNACSAVSVGEISTPSWSTIAPASARFTMRWRVMPMRGSPWRTAQLIGRTAAVFRQQRAVHVEGSESCQIENLLADHVPVIHREDQVRLH